MGFLCDGCYALPPDSRGGAPVEVAHGAFARAHVGESLTSLLRVLQLFEFEKPDLGEARLSLPVDDVSPEIPSLHHRLRCRLFADVTDACAACGYFAINVLNVSIALG